MSAINRESMIAHRARLIFEDRLRHFVRQWAPDNQRDRSEMQIQLCMLLRDAMQSQAETFSAGVERYASMALQNASLAQLKVILEEPKDKA
jgi:hypothetical protein